MTLNFANSIYPNHLDIDQDMIYFHIKKTFTTELLL